MSPKLVLLQMQFQIWLCEASFWQSKGHDFEHMYRDAHSRAECFLQEFAAELEGPK
jgi:hypothetical protein